MQDKKPNEKKLKNKLLGISGVLLVIAYFLIISIPHLYTALSLFIKIILNVFGLSGLFLVLYFFGDFRNEYSQDQIFDRQNRKKEQHSIFKKVKQFFKKFWDFILHKKRKIIVWVFIILTVSFITSLYLNNKKSEVYCLSNIQYSSNKYKITDSGKTKFFTTQDEALFYCKKIIFPKLKNRKGTIDFIKNDRTINLDNYKN